MELIQLPYNLTYSIHKVSASVWRDEAHGRLNNKNNAHEDDEIEEGDDVNSSRVVEHDNLDSSLTNPSRAQANTESSSREVEAAGTQGINFDGDDETSWRSPARASTSGASGAKSSMDQDKEMWDIVNELEQEGQASSGVAASTLQSTIPEPPNRPFDPGEDWDDMYL